MKKLIAVLLLGGLLFAGKITEKPRILSMGGVDLSISNRITQFQMGHNPAGLPWDEPIMSLEGVFLNTKATEKDTSGTLDDELKNTLLGGPLEAIYADKNQSARLYFSHIDSVMITKYSDNPSLEPLEAHEKGIASSAAYPLATNQGENWGGDYSRPPLMGSRVNDIQGYFDFPGLRLEYGRKLGDYFLAGASYGYGENDFTSQKHGTDGSAIENPNKMSYSENHISIGGIGNLSRWSSLGLTFDYLTTKFQSKDSSGTVTMERSQPVIRIGPSFFLNGNITNLGVAVRYFHTGGETETAPASDNPTKSDNWTMDGLEFDYGHYIDFNSNRVPLSMTLRLHGMVRQAHHRFPSDDDVSPNVEFDRHDMLSGWGTVGFAYNLPDVFVLGAEYHADGYTDKNRRITPYERYSQHDEYSFEGMTHTILVGAEYTAAKMIPIRAGFNISFEDPNMKDEGASGAFYGSNDDYVHQSFTFGVGFRKKNFPVQGDIAVVMGSTKRGSDWFSRTSYGYYVNEDLQKWTRNTTTIAASVQYNLPR